MEKYKYEVIIYWSDDDNSYVAEVLNFRGACLTGLRMRRHWPMSVLSLMNGLKLRSRKGELFLNLAGN